MTAKELYEFAQKYNVENIPLYFNHDYCDCEVTDARLDIATCGEDKIMLLNLKKLKLEE